MSAASVTVSTVPTQGIHFAFEKLYANQSKEDAEFSIPYASVTGDRISVFLSVLGALLLWGGIIVLVRREPRIGKNLTAGAILAGVAMLGFAIGYLRTSPSIALWLSLIVVVVLVVVLVGALTQTVMRTSAAPSACGRPTNSTASKAKHALARTI